MSIDKSTWGTAEWKSYALQLEIAYDEGLENYRVMVDALLSSMKMAVAARDEKRAPGRPSKTGKGKFLLDLVDAQEGAFRQANPGIRLSDKAILTWYFASFFALHGVGGYRTLSARFKGQLKTMCNLIGDVRGDRKRQAAKILKNS